MKVRNSIWCSNCGNIAQTLPLSLHKLRAIDRLLGQPRAALEVCAVVKLVLWGPLFHRERAFELWKLRDEF